MRCAVLFAVHEPEGAFGHPSREERGAERVLFDRGGGAERVPADAKYRSISVFDDARGVCEHVRSALEHEGHDAERRAPPFDQVARALAFLDDFTDARRRVRPTAQAVDHVFSHARRELQAPDGAAASARVGDGRCVGAGDFGKLSTTAETVASPLSQRTSMSRNSASVRLEDFFRATGPPFH